jgi:hypothetical protein
VDTVGHDECLCWVKKPDQKNKQILCDPISRKLGKAKKSIVIERRWLGGTEYDHSVLCMYMKMKMS